MKVCSYNIFIDLQCEPLHGFAFKRGGYQCRCKPGYRLPYTVRTPYLGEIIERASPEEYSNGFDCLKIGCKCEKILHRQSLLL